MSVRSAVGATFCTAIMSVDRQIDASCSTRSIVDTKARPKQAEAYTQRPCQREPEEPSS